MVDYFKYAGPCPFTGECEGYNAIVNNEKWVTDELMRLKTVNENPQMDSKGGLVTRSLEGRLASLSKVKKRCVCRCQSCLRFWQLSRTTCDARVSNQPKGYIAHVSPAMAPG